MRMKMSFISASRPATEGHQNRRAALNFAGRERKRQRRCIAKFLAKFMTRRKQPTTPGNSQPKIHPQSSRSHLKSYLKVLPTCHWTHQTFYYWAIGCI